jgi:VanZ family protein
MKNNKTIKCQSSILNGVLVLFWMGVIFCFSAMKGNGYDGVPTFWFYFERKGAHITEYFILNLLLIRFIIKDWLGFNLKESILLASSLSLLYAFTDEIHQLFVYGREGKITDIGFDLIGIILAVAVTGLFFKFRK